MNASWWHCRCWLRVEKTSEGVAAQCWMGLSPPWPVNVCVSQSQRSEQDPISLSLSLRQLAKVIAYLRLCRPYSAVLSTYAKGAHTLTCGLPGAHARRRARSDDLTPHNRRTRPPRGHPTAACAPAPPCSSLAPPVTPHQHHTRSPPSRLVLVVADRAVDLAAAQPEGGELGRLQHMSLSAANVQTQCSG